MTTESTILHTLKIYETRQNNTPNNPNNTVKTTIFCHIQFTFLSSKIRNPMNMALCYWNVVRTVSALIKVNICD